jgi:hypothetical protein
VLTRQGAAGKWAPATYALRKSEAFAGIGHRTHRSHRSQAAVDRHLGPEGRPMTPMSPMPDDLAELEQIPPGAEAKV